MEKRLNPYLDHVLHTGEVVGVLSLTRWIDWVRYSIQLGHILLQGDRAAKQCALAKPNLFEVNVSMVTPAVDYCVSVAIRPRERECLLFQWMPDIIEDLSGPLGDDDA